MHHLQGAQTAERFPRDATLELHVLLRSAVGGDGDAQTERFASLADAKVECIATAGRAALSASKRYESAVRLQALAEQVSRRCCASLPK